jgi:acyl-CoA reductase-like NAD-dependent aldehyde dehydrogenase
MTSPDFSTVAPRVSATPRDDIDKKLARLVANKDAWLKVGTAERAELLQQCIVQTKKTAKDWVRAACQAKGIDMKSPRAGEEWLGGPMATIRNLRLFREAMLAGGEPPLPGMRTTVSGQTAVKVFPQNTFDGILFGGITAEVWLEPGRPATQGRIYREKREGKSGLDGAGHGGVGLVLGAGNVASIGPMDAIYKLFVDDEVALVKTNPVNAYLQPFWEESFRPLLDLGVFAVVRGGAEVGAYLCNHPDISTVHITGSDRTHDAIVWGPPKEQAQRKREGRPVLKKPITSELGAVTPCIIVPGQWTQEELAYQAENVAGMVTNNASLNCNACKMLVMSEGWAQKEEFLGLVRAALENTPARQAYYPGAQERFQGFLDRYPNAEMLGERTKEVVPWTILPEVPPEAGEYALSNEAFCGVLGQTYLPESDPGAFLEAATRFANDVCWGTLSCMVLISPREEERYQRSFEETLAGLRYGGIAVNTWAAMNYALVTTTWGAFPGHPLEDIQSGRGVVHNGLLLDHPQKSIVRAPFVWRMPLPFMPPLKHAYFASHKSLHTLGEALVAFEADPSIFTIGPVLSAGTKA